MPANLKFRIITTKGVVPAASVEKTPEENVKALVKKATGDEHSPKKRSSETSLADPKKKIQRIDQTVKLWCGNILKELMTHRSGWIFNEPFDPVKWNIHDYFSVINNPMDLGTIKDKIERNKYLCADEFASDVRLTYSNAMFYNPQEDDVHKLAKLNIGSFNKKWKILEAKLKREDSVKIAEKSCQDTLFSYVDATDDKTLRKLRKEIDISFNPRAGKVKPPKIVGKKSNLLKKTVQKGTENRGGYCSSINHRQMNTTTRCSSCGDIICDCHDKSDPAPPQMYSSRLTSDSDGPGVVLNNEEHVNLSTPPPTTAASGEGCASFHVPLSPEKAVRAAMLKKRFARTMYKATHQGETCYSGRAQQEIERMERKELESNFDISLSKHIAFMKKVMLEEEKIVVEQTKALKARAQMMQLKEERETARLAISKMKITDLDENCHIMMDLERLGLVFSYPSEENPLKNLGLYIKAEYSLKEDKEKDGEIL